MADEEEKTGTNGGGGAKRWILVAGVAVLFGAGGFYVPYSGLIGGGSAEATPAPVEGAVEGPVFADLEPLQISVGGEGSIQQLRFRATLQLTDSTSDTVLALQPRILDILATYLRALPTDVLRDPTALLKIRAQMLQRIQLLTGPGVVEDLLIIDFVIA
jgi:flagellar FliL protein